MLLEFRLGNFRSYAAEKRLSMVAGSGEELPTNTITVEGFERYPLLRSAAIYGANASGKSNLIHAFAFLRVFVLRSSELQQEGDEIPVAPFLLDPVLAGKPSEFEITFLLDGVRHQYGVIASRERVHEEWLTVYPKGKPQAWFHREVDGSGKSKWVWSRTYLKGDKAPLGERTRENALFLSVAAQWNHQQLTPIYQWFRNRLEVLPQNVGAMSYTRNRLLKDAGFRDWMTHMLKSADVGVSQVRAKEIEVRKDQIPFPSDMPPQVREYFAERMVADANVAVTTIRRIPGMKKPVEWDLDQESDGTQRMLELLGPIRNVLEKGSVLVMDELDTSLHAHITHAMVQLFNHPETNPNHAQLIFTTHDVSLLDPTIFRRDQIWFTAKDERGATDLYSLQDYSPRKGEAIQKGYLAGRYGGTPVLRKFEFSPSQSSKKALAATSSED